MKNINILIAVFAVMAAASVAMAEDIKVDFDGRGGGAFTGDIKAAVEKGGFSQFTAEPSPTVNCGGVDYAVEAMPISCGGWSMPPEFLAAFGRGADKFAKGTDGELLARVYIAQPGIKEMLTAHFAQAGDENNSKLLAVKGVRVVSDRRAVYLLWNNTTVKIDNPALAARVYAAIYPAVGGQIPANKLLVEAAIVGAIGCMTSDDCWGAIGDGVSSVSEWLHS